MNGGAEIAVDVQLFVGELLFVLPEIVLDGRKVHARQIAIKEEPVHEDGLRVLFAAEFIPRFGSAPLSISPIFARVGANDELDLISTARIPFRNFIYGGEFDAEFRI